MKFNLIQNFEDTVKENATKIAIKEDDHTIDFFTLQKRSKKLSSVINFITNSTYNLPIAVFLPKSIDCIIADIAITYSGNTYMNIDIKSPNNRIQNILNLILPSIIITRSDLIPSLKNLSNNITIIEIDKIEFNINDTELNFLEILLDNIIDTDPYCIINTSGSTGTPKGVVLNHRSFFDFIDWSIEKFNFTNNDMIGSLSPQVFDIYSFELCLLMTKGSTLILIPEKDAAFPIKIIELLEKEKISFLFWVPTIMVNIANMNLLSNIYLPNLKLIWFAGEVFPTKQFNYWKKYLPQSIFVNLYGPIEITLDCTYFIVNREFDDSEPLPIGIPCRNTSILILNDQNLPANKGEMGELCIRGSSLAMGYYNNPEKTSLVFVQNPLNKSFPELIYRTGDIVSYNERDEIIFKGRKDTLIKHSGYRIELGEIEHVIVNVLQIVKNCFVTYNVDKKEIIAVYESNEEIADKIFRAKILLEIPKYMVPSKFIRMEQLPRNINGKIDRLTLKNLIIDDII